MSSKEIVGKIIVTGGGTGGHVFPAIAIAEELKRRNFEVLYVGGPGSMEARLVPKQGLAFFSVQSVQVKNKSPLSVLKGIVRLTMAVLWSIRFLLQHRPKAVIGVGGYVSVPIAFSSFLLRIPLYLQEQNASVGIANRFLGKLAKTIFLGFKSAESSFPSNRCLVSGNPIRSEFRMMDRTPAEKTCLLVFGGSQGARAINSAILQLLPKLFEKFPDLLLIHQTGALDYDRTVQAYPNEFKERCEVHAFINDMLSAYKRASLVVSRSGALTVSELLSVQRPAILVPFPRRGQNDQVDNAKTLENLGVAWKIEEGTRFVDRLWKQLENSLLPQNLKTTHKNFSELHVPDALATIGDHLVNDLSPN